MVPVEPTADMVIAGEDAWDAQLDKRLFAKEDGEPFAPYPSEETHELCSRVAYRAMLAAAPAVQEEPVAWVTVDTVDGQTVNGKPRRIWWENKEGVGIPIYTAPQPTEQQPEPISPNLRAVHAMILSALDRDAADGKAVRGEMAAELRSALSEQQPAPDVSELVGALCRCLHEANYSIGCEDALKAQLEKVREIANDALSAYHKQGVEP